MRFSQFIRLVRRYEKIGQFQKRDYGTQIEVLTGLYLDHLGRGDLPVGEATQRANEAIAVVAFETGRLLPYEKMLTDRGYVLLPGGVEPGNPEGSTA